MYLRVILWFLTVAPVFGAELQSIDINTSVAGFSTSLPNSGLEIKGAGADIWNTSDGFRFTYQEMVGDFDIQACVTSIQNVDPWSKAGVMIRRSLEAGSQHAMMVATSANGLAFQYRNETNGTSAHIGGGPRLSSFSWVRLIRTGSSIRAYKSDIADASDWDYIGQMEMSVVEPVFAGFCVTSHNAGTLCTAHFQHIGLKPLTSPTVGNGDGLHGKYFNTHNLTSSAILSRIDSSVDFDWNTSSPDPLINADNFSIQWHGKVQAQYSESYTFYVTADDGVRLWIDNKLVINDWTDHAASEIRSFPVQLQAGHKYDIVLEYFEHSGLANCKLRWSSQSTLPIEIPQSQLYSENIPPAIAQGTSLTGEYYSDSNLQTLLILRQDSQVNFDWGNGSPAQDVPPDHFSVRWIGRVEPQYAGLYTFYAQCDDGVRLWVDDILVINNWTDHAVTENAGQIALEAGKRYSLRMEYFENGGQSVAKLLWSSAATEKEIIPAVQLYPGTGTGLFAEYFDNPNFTGNAVSRIDSVINFDWQGSPPISGIDAETYSVRWTGTVVPHYSESYTFYTVSDDGVRLWINDQLIIDNWTNHSATENGSTLIPAIAGVPLKIKMEYFENTGNATAKLLWESASESKKIIPFWQLQPNGGLLAVIPLFSYISPAFVEGQCWAPGNQTFSIQSNTPITMLGKTHFYSDVQLSEGDAASVSFTHSVTGVQQTGTISWLAVELAGKDFSQSRILLRPNDSLMFTISGTGGTIAIDANGDSTPDYTGAIGDKFIFQYTAPGSYVVEGRIDGISVGTLLVNVIDVDFSKPVACEVGFKREKNIDVLPSILRNDVVFTAVDSSNLELGVQGETPNGIKLLLGVKSAGSPIFTARLGSPQGPIIKFKEVDDFVLVDSLAGGFIYGVGDDEFGHIDYSLKMTPRIPDLDITINFFVPNASIFGQSTYTFSSNELDCNGEWHAPIVMEPNTNKTCHTVTVSQKE